MSNLLLTPEDVLDAAVEAVSEITSAGPDGKLWHGRNEALREAELALAALRKRIPAPPPPSPAPARPPTSALTVGDAQPLLDMLRAPADGGAAELHEMRCLLMEYGWDAVGSPVDRLRLELRRSVESAARAPAAPEGALTLCEARDSALRVMRETEERLAAERTAAPEPRPPSDLVDALQDRIHSEGVGRPAKSVRADAPAVAMGLLRGIGAAWEPSDDYPEVRVSNRWLADVRDFLSTLAATGSAKEEK